MGSRFPIPKHTPQLEVKMKIFLTSLLFSAIVSMTWARGCHTELKTVWKTEFKETEEEKCQTINEDGVMKSANLIIPKNANHTRRKSVLGRSTLNVKMIVNGLRFHMKKLNVKRSQRKSVNIS